MIVIAAVVGAVLADAATENATCSSQLVDESEVSDDWVFVIITYLPGVLAGVGIGAMTRRRFVSGWLLLAGALIGTAGLAIIGFLFLAPCLE